MKSIIVAGLLLGCAHGVQAAPYANVEANQSYVDGEVSTAVDIHVGTEGSFAGGSWYVQGGPVLIDGATEEVELSGKAGGSLAVSDELSIYGELSFLTGTDLAVGTKAGVKYVF